MFLGKILTSPLPGERIVFYLRRHWWVVAKQVVIYLSLALLPVAVFVLLPTYLPVAWDELTAGGPVTVLAKLAASVYYLGVWLFFWRGVVDYYLDVWIVTNERVVAREQHDLFNRQVVELRLSRVQDVSAAVRGLWGTMLGFGEVRVETAGEEENFIFHNVPHPYQVSEQVLRLADDWRHVHPNQPGP